MKQKLKLLQKASVFFRLFASNFRLYILVRSDKKEVVLTVLVLCIQSILPSFMLCYSVRGSVTLTCCKCTAIYSVGASV